VRGEPTSEVAADLAVDPLAGVSDLVTRWMADPTRPHPLQSS
jgi:hypothetical protein